MAGMWDGRHVGWQACLLKLIYGPPLKRADRPRSGRGYLVWSASQIGQAFRRPDSGRLVEERLTYLPVDEGNTYPGKSLALAWRYEYWAAILRITQRSRLLKVLCVSRLLP